VKQHSSSQKIASKQHPPQLADMVPEDLHQFLAGDGYTKNFIQEYASDYSIIKQSELHSIRLSRRNMTEVKKYNNTLFTNSILSDDPQHILFLIQGYLRPADKVLVFEYIDVNDFMNGSKEYTLQYTTNAFRIEYSTHEHFNGFFRVFDPELTVFSTFSVHPDDVDEFSSEVEEEAVNTRESFVCCLLSVVCRLYFICISILPHFLTVDAINDEEIDAGNKIAEKDGSDAGNDSDGADAGNDSDGADAGNDGDGADAGNESEEEETDQIDNEHVDKKHGRPPQKKQADEHEPVKRGRLFQKQTDLEHVVVLKKRGRPPKKQADQKKRDRSSTQAEHVVKKKKLGPKPVVIKKQMGRPPKNQAEPVVKKKLGPKPVVVKKRLGRPPKNQAEPVVTKKKLGRPPKSQAEPKAVVIKKKSGRPSGSGTIQADPEIIVATVMNALRSVLGNNIKHSKPAKNPIVPADAQRGIFLMHVLTFDINCSICLCSSRCPIFS
jgi:hypothetical protein